MYFLYCSSKMTSLSRILFDFPSLNHTHDSQTDALNKNQSPPPHFSISSSSASLFINFSLSLSLSQSYKKAKKKKKTIFHGSWSSAYEPVPV